MWMKIFLLDLSNLSNSPNTLDQVTRENISTNDNLIIGNQNTLSISIPVKYSCGRPR